MEAGRGRSTTITSLSLQAEPVLPHAYILEIIIQTPRTGWGDTLWDHTEDPQTQLTLSKPMSGLPAVSINSRP